MSEVFDEDTGEFCKRTLSNLQVLAFISRYWMRRRWACFTTIGLILVAIGFESMMPRAAEALVDATRHIPASASVAWQAWLFFVGVYLAYSLIRNLGIRFFWNPLAASNMQEMTNEARQRLRRLAGVAVLRRRLSGLQPDPKSRHPLLLESPGRFEHAGDDQRGVPAGAGLLLGLTWRYLRRRHRAAHFARH